jgi:hypothetical protein
MYLLPVHPLGHTVRDRQELCIRHERTACATRAGAPHTNFFTLMAPFYPTQLPQQRQSRRPHVLHRRSVRHRQRLSTACRQHLSGSLSLQQAHPCQHLSGSLSLQRSHSSSSRRVCATASVNRVAVCSATSIASCANVSTRVHTRHRHQNIGCDLRELTFVATASEIVCCVVSTSATAIGADATAFVRDVAATMSARASDCQIRQQNALQFTRRAPATTRSR